jgi:2-haloacid dehalogenase
MRYDLILFDLDDTLLDFGAGQRAALAALIERLGFAASETLIARFLLINEARWRRLERGEITRAEVLEGRFAELFAELAIEACATTANRDFLAHLATSAVLVDGAHDACAAAARAARVGIVTNGHGPTARSRLARASVADHVAFMIVTDELGVPKPDPAIFRAALAASGLDATARVLMIGDNPTADVAGALAAGFDACWFNPHGLPIPPGIRPTFAARTLAEALALAAAPSAKGAQ